MRISDWSSDVCSSDLLTNLQNLRNLRGLLTRHLPVIIMTRVMRGRRRYHEPRRYAAVAGHRRQRSSSDGSYLAVAGLIGAAVGGGWAMTDHERQQIGRASCGERVCQYV